MADKNIVAVFRRKDYSPNHIGTDAAILNDVCDQLKKRGCAIVSCSEEMFCNEASSLTDNPDAIITMSRSPQCIDILKTYETQGIPVINSAFAIENCRRGTMCRILAGHNIPMAEYTLAATNEKVLDRLHGLGFDKCWVKQADQHSMHKEDVAFVRHPEEAQEMLHEFFMRGIKSAVICRHIHGEMIRFYGVKGTDFFQWFFPLQNNQTHSGISIEKREELEKRIFSMCDYAAELLDIQIYGGDCVLTPDGEVRIINFNDWPSFAPCRTKAAKAIAKLVLNTIKGK